MGYLYLQQKVFSIGESFTFFDLNQRPVFTARGSFFAIPKRYELYNAMGAPLIEITRKFFTFMPKFILRHAGGEVLCQINQRFRLGGARFDIITPNDGVYEIRGSLLAHDFTIHNAQGEVIVKVSKHWLAWGDTYEIMFNENLITAQAAAAMILTIDCALHSNR